MKLKIFLFIYIFTVCNVFSQSESDVPGLKLISKNSLMKTVNFLASKELAGRLSGSDGFNKAAYYMANEFKSAGLRPLGDNGYFQNLNVEYNEILPPVILNLVKDGKTTKKYKLGKDFVCRGFTGSGKFVAPVVFCGYGISNPEVGYDDYAGIDVKGKVVLCFKYNPAWKLKDTINWGENLPRQKSFVAAEHGAIGILFVSTPNDKNPQKTILSILHGEGIQDEEFPELHIDIPAADEFLSGSRFTLSDLQSEIDLTKKPFSLQLKTSAEIEVHAKYTKEQPTMNIIGLLPGSDEKLKDEYLVIGAHLDHVGSQGNEIYAPGANDNASGSAAVLEIAKALVKGKVYPKRSVIFVLFASEEIGLAGSKYFVEHSPVPLDKIEAMINMDCVGYGDSIQVGNGKSAPNLWNIAKEKDSIYTKMMVKNTWSGGGADATSFHQKGVPCAYFVTTNSYEHLHYITDTPETLNKSLFEKITKLVYLTAYNIANGNYEREIIMK
jgi:hypothetical protein